jgi:acetyl esterase/lipase
MRAFSVTTHILFRRLSIFIYSALLTSVVCPSPRAFGDDAPQGDKFQIPATDDGLPGEGPVRRSDWFQKTWRERRSSFAKHAEGDQGAVVFFGDSITQGWGDDFRGKFPGMKLANRGISGDTTRGMLIRLDEDVLSLKPKAVVMLMGTNDLADKAEPKTIVGNIKLILDRFHEYDAKMPVVVCKVMPSSAEKDRAADKIKEINELLSEAVKDRPNVTLVDTWTLFANDQGDAKPKEFPDLLHPNDAGYAKWADALKPVFERLELSSSFKRTEDVIYGRKFGTALTMDVFTPQKPNGYGVILCVSGGWFSAHETINAGFCGEPLNRGYTVFAVVHGSQPKFTIPEVLVDMHRAVRYIRHHAADYKIHPDHIGIMGGSAGGHLSLMQGTAGTAGNAQAPDAVDRESSRVQAVGCFFPPTDFLNYGQPGEVALGRGKLSNFRAPFDFHEWSEPEHRFVEITDEGKLEEIGKQISPIYHVSSDDAPTLIIHGDADTLVPIQQGQIMVDKLKEAGVKAELVTKPGAGHGWPDLFTDTAKIADWFDSNLKPQ